jgi:hypothetical protein
MKTHKQILLIFFFTTVVVLHSCTDKINTGLVAYYPFNGNANDMSGNNNNCKVQGTRLTTDRFGKSNSAYYFDGESAMMFTDIKNMHDLSTPHSLSWWYETDTIQSFADSLGAGNMFALVDTSSGIGVQSGFRAPAYHTSGFDVWKWGGGTFLQNDIPAVKVRHHCAYLFDGITHRFFLDSKEVANSTAAPCKGIPKQLMFGNYPSGHQYLNGKLDDIYLYNRALTTREIHYLSTKPESDDQKY